MTPPLQLTVEASTLRVATLSRELLASGDRGAVVDIVADALADHVADVVVVRRELDEPATLPVALVLDGPSRPCDLCDAPQAYGALVSLPTALALAGIVDICARCASRLLRAIASGMGVGTVRKIRTWIALDYDESHANAPADQVERVTTPRDGIEARRRRAFEADGDVQNDGDGGGK